MKYSKVFVLLLILDLFSAYTYSQLWKRYSDSAKVYVDQKRPDKAIEYYYKTNEQLRNDSSVTLSHAQNNYELAVLFKALGQYEKSEPFYLESKQIRQEILGKEDPSYAISCNGLANLYKARGQYAKAEPLYLELKLKVERALGKENPEYAATCNGLANLYTDMGQYEKAEFLHLES